MSTGLKITMIAPDGTRWPVHGPGRAPGLTLGRGSVEGLMDAPVETDWIEDTAGATYAGERWKPRDLTLGFFVAEELAGGPTAGRLESDFRRAFTTRLDRWDPAARLPKIEVESVLSGVRVFADVHLRADPKMKMDIDPYTGQFFDLAYELRCPQPLALEASDQSVFVGSGSSGSGTIVVSNPTDTVGVVTWVLTRAKWTIPDPSWVGPVGERVPGGVDGDRTIPLPTITEADGGVKITRQPRTLHAMTFARTNFLTRMAGNFVRYEIPPYTPETELPISYTGAPDGGARAELYVPRLWSRPVGLEMP